jgi:CBS domain-containing protein
MNARDLMTSNVLACRAQDSLNSAAQMMWDGDVGSVAVLDDHDRLCGVVTDRDACMAAYTQGRRLDEIVTAEVMARDPITCGPDATLGEIETIMRRHQIRRVFVVDDQRRPMGVVSLNDLARASADHHRGQAALVSTLAAICQPRGGLVLRAAS